jgi:hypothetical protein
MSDKGLALDERPLTNYERELTRWLIEHGTSSEKARLDAQVDSLTVHERCLCGCPTIYFALNGVPVSRRGEMLISDHFATVDSQGVGVMLFETDGQLSSLEVYSCAGSELPFGLPRIDTLKPEEPL